MADETVFEHCVRGILHSAIPISLERSLDLEIGSVLVYEKKPTRWKPWRKHSLVFTGYSINDLLKTAVPIKTDQVVMYDSANYSRTIDDNVDLDADVKSSLVDFGMNFNVGEKRVLSGNFGKLTRIRWNLRDEVIHGTFKATMNTDHVITKDAAEHGSTIFVVTHLFQADKVILTLDSSVTFGGGMTDDEKKAGDTDGDTSDPNSTPSGTDPSGTDPSGTDPSGTTPSGTNPPTLEPTDGKQDAKDKGDVSSKAGVTRNSPTFIAFHVLAFTFDAKGALNMKLRSDLSKVKLKYLEEVDLGGIGVHVAGHIKEDQECPHTLGADDVAAYCEQEDKKL